MGRRLRIELDIPEWLSDDNRFLYGHYYGPYCCQTDLGGKPAGIMLIDEDEADRLWDKYYEDEDRDD